jgi:branched-subunit amino acid ABC-type transport system permease component
VGGLLIGLIQDLATGISIGGMSIPSSYKSLIAFSVLIFFLLFRPRGLFGISLEEDKSQKE